MSLVKLFVSMDFDWPLVINSTSIPIFNHFTPFVFELNVPLHQNMDLASNAQLVAFIPGMNIIICMSLVKHVVSMDFDWPPIIGNTFISFFSPSTPFVVKLNVPLHQSMDLASNARKWG
jgi:hypothetical protein